MSESPTDVQGRIFISYRRDDTAYPAGWLFDRLAERFGVDQIFKDVDSIELGDDFVEVLTDAVGSTDVLLALIGEKWLKVTGEDGSRRLDDPDDFVRLEIEAALKQRVRIIPILVEGAEMPGADEVPPSLKPLVRRQAMELSSSRFTFDTDRLLVVLERILAQAGKPAGPPPEPKDEVAEPEERGRPPEEERGSEPEPAEEPSWRERLLGRRRLLVAIVGAAVLLALAIGGVILFRGGDEPDATPNLPQETLTEEAPTTEETPADGINGRIAYQSDDEIWSARLDGSGRSPLATGLATVRRPDWSPDGTRVVFASDRTIEGDFDLWILDTRTGRPTPLTDGPAEDGSPAWSPDGSEVAFGRQESGQATKDIWVVDVQTGDLRRLTDDPAPDDAPDWSSTDRVAFESQREDENYEIYTLDPSGLERDVRRVTSNTWSDASPDWSPDGERIAYRVIRGSTADIYTIDSEGQQRPQQITDDTAFDHRPSWSPDGKLIAFDSAPADDQTDTEIFAVASGGGRPEPLITGPGNPDSPSWGTAP